MSTTRKPKETIVNRLQDILKYDKKGWIYRGQTCAEWSLTTSLERACKSFGIDLSKARRVEEVLIRDFRRRLHHYEVHVPDHDDLEWLSLMQHFGAPTRLLDWTYSIYAAVYFAVEKPPGDSSQGCAVWALDSRWALNETYKIVSSSVAFSKLNSDDQKMVKEYLKERNEERHVPHFAKIFFNEPAVACACPVNPWRLNERLTIQNGVFMCPGDVSKSFEDNLCALPGCGDKHLAKLVIPASKRWKVLAQLYAMNMNSATLFPGLDGFARSLSIYHPLLEELRPKGKRT